MWNDFLVRHFFEKNFDKLGKHPMVVGPMTAEIFGENITAGDYLEERLVEIGLKK